MPITKKVFDYFTHAPCWLVVFVGTGLLSIVGVLDALTGYEIELFIFYIFPILFVTWFGSRRVGIVFSVVAGVESVVVDYVELGGLSFAVLFWNVLVRLTFFVGLVVLVDMLRRALNREAVRSRTDPLTGISNRRYFTEYLKTELQRARRFKHPLSLLYLDVDDFKSINDMSGHATGDRLLKAVGNVLSANVRKIDVAARLGGDEFVVVLPELTHENAKEFAARFNTALSNEMRRHQLPVTFSKGLVTFANPPESPDAVLSQADDAMYSAKSGGKNRTVYRNVG